LAGGGFKPPHGGMFRDLTMHLMISPQSLGHAGRRSKVSASSAPLQSSLVDKSLGMPGFNLSEICSRWDGLASYSYFSLCGSTSSCPFWSNVGRPIAFRYATIKFPSGKLCAPLVGTAEQQRSNHKQSALRDTRRRSAKAHMQKRHVPADRDIARVPTKNWILRVWKSTMRPIV
jgi:hypothetical protein